MAAPVIAPYPHLYVTDIQRTQGAQGTVLAVPRPALEGGPPPEFGGKEQWWSPEHLLMGAIGLCHMTTFAAIASRSKLEVLDYRCRAEGTVEKTPEGIAFTKVSLHVAVKVAPADKERALRLIEMAEKHCMVSNSLKRPVELVASVEAS